jgi:lactate permease
LEDRLDMLLIFVPILSLIIGLFLFKGRILYISAVSFILAIIIGRFYWGMYDFALAGAIIKAFFIAFDISLVIFGALMFLEFMRKRHVLRSIILYLYRLSDDLRVQFIFIGWLFGAFIEGTAGFGVPGLLISPLLIGLGLTPIQAVSLALLSNTIPVTFGAAGTPIRVGFYDFDNAGITFYTGIFGLGMSIIWPVVLLFVLTKFLKKDRHYFYSGLPFAVLSGLAFGLPYFLVSRFNQDLPTILGSVAGILIMGILVKIFKKPNMEVTLSDKIREVLNVTHIDEKLPFYKTILPYLFLIVFILAGRLVPEFDKSNTLNFLGDFSHTFRLFNPGIPSILALALSLIFLKPEKGDFKALFKIVLPKLFRTALLIFLITGIMQIIISSGLNNLNQKDMLSFMFEGIHENLAVYFVPMLGALGAFLSGSATVSNILIGGLTRSFFGKLSLQLPIILAAQLMGAAGGNMVSLQNIITGQLTAGPIQDEEISILKITFPWLLLYVAISTLLLGFVLSLKQ